MSLSKCRTCGELKQKIFSGKKDHRGKSINCDELGSRWYFAQCPDCKKIANNVRARALAAKKAAVRLASNPKELLGPSQPLRIEKLRNCRKCGDKTINYFKCTTCYSREVDYAEEAWGF